MRHIIIMLQKQYLASKNNVYEWWLDKDAEGIIMSRFK
jgi:hypothetical protein